MKKIAEFFSKWAFVIILSLVGLVLLFALSCCIYTAVTNPLVGILGSIGVAVALASIVGLIVTEIKEG